MNRDDSLRSAFSARDLLSRSSLILPGERVRDEAKRDSQHGFSAPVVAVTRSGSVSYATAKLVMHQQLLEELDRREMISVDERTLADFVEGFVAEALATRDLPLNDSERRQLRFDDLLQLGMFSTAMRDLLRFVVRGRKNMLISGGTGSGKSTFLGAVAEAIPESERIVTIEDAAELQLDQGHVVRMETRPPNIEGQGRIVARDLLINSLRMRPDRIIVGEVRGGEALDMLQAMNTGHDGGMTTIHANSPRDALSRLETMVLMAGIDLPSRAIREQTASAIDIIVQVRRYEDGVRRVQSISELVGMEGDTPQLQEIFRFAPKGKANNKILGDFVATGIVTKVVQDMRSEEIDIPMSLFQPPTSEGNALRDTQW